MLSTLLKRAGLLSISMLTIIFSFAQDRVVTGKVTDSKDGAPVSGASVLVKDSIGCVSTFSFKILELSAIDGFSKNVFEIYPNPASDFIVFSVPNLSRNNFLTISNSNQILFKQKITSIQTIIDLTRFPTGELIFQYFEENQLKDVQRAMLTR